MKYVILRRTSGKGKSKLVTEIPVMFPNSLVHAHVAEVMKVAINPSDDKDVIVVPVAAGDYCPLNGKCTGHSTTLKLQSRKMDEHIIRMHDYTGGVVL